MINVFTSDSTCALVREQYRSFWFSFSQFVNILRSPYGGRCLMSNLFRRNCSISETGFVSSCSGTSVYPSRSEGGKGGNGRDVVGLLDLRWGSDLSRTIGDRVPLGEEDIGPSCHGTPGRVVLLSVPVHMTGRKVRPPQENLFSGLHRTPSSTSDYIKSPTLIPFPLDMTRNLRNFVLKGRSIGLWSFPPVSSEVNPSGLL